MSSPQLGQVMARVEMSRTPPSLMSGPTWRVGPSRIVSKALGKGPGSHPSLISPEHLRLLWDYSWGLLLLHWSAKSNPGPEAGTTPGTYHICSQRGKAAGLTAESGTALRSHSGWTRAQLNQGKPWLGQGTAGSSLAVAGCGNGGNGGAQGGSAAG